MAVETSTAVVILPGMVYIDTVGGVSFNPDQPSTIVGTATLPVNNLADAIVLAVLRNTNNFHVKNGLTVDADLANYNFVGDNDWYVSFVDLNNHDLTGCTFQGLTVIGNSPGYIVCVSCFVTGTAFDLTPAIISGDLINCRVGSIKGIPSGFPINCYNCISSGSPFVFDIGGGGGIGWAGGSGGINVYNADNPFSIFNLVSILGGIYLDPSCVNGNIYIEAANDVHDVSAGSFVFDISTYGKAKEAVQSYHITSPANAGNVVIATVSDIRHIGVTIEKMVLRSNGVTTGDLTSAAIYGEAGGELTLISAAVATQAALNAAGKQVNTTGGPWTIRDAQTLIVNLIGTGATHVDLTLDIFFRALSDGARFR